MNLSKFSYKQNKKKAPGRKYKNLRTICLAGIMLLGFYAVATFPGYYEEGPDTQQWLMIGFCMLSAIILFYITLASNSWEGKSPHDWHTSGGSLHAFTFGVFSCKKCGAKRILVSLGKNGEPVFVTPGKAAPEGGGIKFYCPYCVDSVDESGCEKKEFQFSRMNTLDMAELGKNFKKNHRAYRLSKEYTRRYALVTLILFFLEISAVSFAKKEAVRLLLPLVLGYFLFVSAYNMLTSIVSRYYVAGKGVVQRTLWGYSLYEVKKGASLVCFNDSEDSATWGLYSLKENILISPIIEDSKLLLAQLQAVCREKSVPIIK